MELSSPPSDDSSMTKGARHVTVPGLFFRWCRKVFDLPALLQGVSDTRKQGQVEFPSNRMAALGICYCLSMARSNAEFFQVHAHRRPVRLLSGFSPNCAPSQDTFEYVLKRLKPLSLRRVRRQVIKRMKLNKVFGASVIVAIDGKEITLPHGHFEDCAVRHTENGPVFYYKVLIICTIGPRTPPAILGVALCNEANELNKGRELLRQTLREFGSRFVDVVVADRGYIDSKLVNELRNEFGVDVVLEPKKDMRVLEEGRALLELEPPAPTYGTIELDGTGAHFRFREVANVVDVWDGLEVPRLRFIEAHQLDPWPDSRGKRQKRTRYIITTLAYGTAERVHRLLRWRWWIENTNWDLEHRFQLEHLPCESWKGLEAYLELLALAYTLFHCFVQRQLKRRQAMDVTLTSLLKNFVIDLAGLPEQDARVVSLARAG